jgi:tetratricopeptide (TPR) repeat protein
MNLVKSLIPGLVVLGFAAGGLNAQAIILKGDERINAGSFSVADGKIKKKVKLSNGQEAEAVIPLDAIQRLEWPEIREVLEAQTLLAEGKTKEALDTLQKARDFFKPFKSIPGNPYNEVIFAHAEALDQAGDFDSLIRVLPEVEGVKWDDAHKLKLRLLKLNMQRRTSGDQEAVLADAQEILTETDDASVCARLWMTIAEIHSKRERWEEALMAYLHVPVFYGSQGGLVPQAQLSAARTLSKMERHKDAVGFYQRIMEQYAGGEIANTAKTEMMIINGLPNRVDKLGPPGKNSENKTESTTETKTESK